MKKIKLLIIGWCIMSFIGNTFAERVAIQEKTDTWLQPKSVSATSIPIIPGGTTSPADPAIGTPVGDALPIMILLAGAYLIRKRFVVLKN